MFAKVRFNGLFQGRIDQESTAGAGKWFNPGINAPKRLPVSVFMV
ncbi:hypothetical protein [Bacillus salacetis]|nr:hypothetical protein [Bacillus salacetis]